MIYFFKKLFGEKGCEKLVSHFINCILENPPFQEKNGANYKVKELNVDFENLVFLNPHVNANKIKEKDPIMDVKLETNKFSIHIEAQR